MEGIIVEKKKGRGLTKHQAMHNKFKKREKKREKVFYSIRFDTSELLIAPV